MAEISDEELLADLGYEIPEANTRKFTPREERIIAGFEEIVRFVSEHGHAPRHGEFLDIFERLYAVRLDQIRSLPEAKSLLSELDVHALLADSEEINADSSQVGDEELLGELGIEITGESNVAVLKHVPSREEKRAAEEIAFRTRCEDFESFEPLFEKVTKELAAGVRKTRRFSGDINISKGEFFILGGQMAYVAERGPTFKTPSGEPDARLRLIYSNGTESNLLLRSLQRALYKDEAGRRLTDPLRPSLFESDWDVDSDVLSGTIYVLRSNSDHQFIANHRDLIHKIGVTRGTVEARIANAKLDATFLLADVEVVATYKLARIDRVGFERILHKVFSEAQLDITIEDRFGHPVSPKEWFMVPLSIIDEVIERIRDGTISDTRYDPAMAKLVKA